MSSWTTRCRLKTWAIPGRRSTSGLNPADRNCFGRQCELSMSDATDETRLAARTIVAAARRLLIDRATPILIALDGASGTGKSALAALVAEALGATVVPGDDFFAAEITDAEWAARSPSERAADAIDWRRLRRDALQPLRAGKPGAWRAFDFKA